MVRRLSSVVSAVALGAGTLVAGVGTAEADEAIIVRPGESIQAAINAATPGTTVTVKKGVYRENLEITTDRVTLIGSGAKLRFPTQPLPNVCGDPDIVERTSGICIHGEVTFGSEGPIVGRPVRGVKVTGFSVQGFGGTGIFVIGGADTVIDHNRLLNNTEYGIFSNSSTGTVIAENRTTSSSEAGIYVGDSPQSRAKVVGNTTDHNSLGVFIRDAQRGTLDDNLIHDNCVGTLVLADAPGPAGGFRMTGNTIIRNRKFCPPNAEEQTPALSGIGVALVGGQNMNIQKNWIVDNGPSGPVDFTGGVVLIRGDSTAPHGNSLRRNVIVANELDIFSDGTGSGNVLESNFCQTSEPSGLCVS